MSTTPSYIVALKKSIIEQTFAIENMKKPLSFKNDGPTFLDPYDFVFVLPTMNNLDMFEEDCSNYFVPRATTCKLYNK